MGRFDGQNVVVVGLAKSGVAAVRLLVREGARVVATDARQSAELAPALAVLDGTGVRFELGGHDPATLSGADLVVVSPGVRTDTALFGPARRRGVRVIGELDLASAFLPCPAVAVTGTNGKSTTTAFLGHLLLAAGTRVFVGGNLGTPLSDAVLSGEAIDVAVVEVSSFQLETIEAFRPAVSLFLNLKPDHMDRYPTFGDYAAAKARIFMNQGPEDSAVLNADDLEVGKAASGIRPRVFGFSSSRALERGVTIKMKPGAFELVWAAGGGAEAYLLRNPRIPGRHNAENAAAALAAARLCGAPPAAVAEALNTFAGLEHRIEFVADRGGAAWYNDSKATNVDSVAVSLGSLDRPIVWIAGGRHKGAPYAPLRDLVAGRVKAGLLIGESAPLIAADLDGAAPFTMCGTLENAVKAAAEAAAPGDAVLLSPACSSYDQFADYEERGRVFKTLVKALPGGPRA
ncbi:MAG: UDP-N-acetylmuramoyl-L-alanine--D-glutamate ligase [Deltaproteobacteria bacterium]|nr:UDP-N-acetylmuramoyl-L-alanine--D-glutamate ligase [Deltaproteobacteria bacterium]